MTIASIPPLLDSDRARFDAGSRLRELVRFATRAPSSHNTQPWLFRVRGDTLELFADVTRRLPTVDPHDRALIMSCGAALGSLRVALRNYGYAGDVEIFPHEARPDLLARVRLGGEHRPTLEDQILFDAIPFRHTNRGPFAPAPVPEMLLRELSAIAMAEGVWLRTVTEDVPREEIAELVAEGTRLQAADPVFRREVADWIRPNRSAAHDGIPGAAYGVPDLPSRLFPWFVRHFEWGESQAKRDAESAMQAPVLAVLGTDTDARDEWLRTGEALARLLLRATAAGVSASFFNQPIEVKQLRPRLACAIGVRGHPQLLFRLGYGAEVKLAPRRSLEEVMLL